MNKKILSLTGIVDFIPPDLEVIHLNKINFDQVGVECVWDDRSRYDQANAEIEKMYECLLPRLVKEYNRIFSNDYDEAFYELILGRWLLEFISVAYDRFYRLKQLVINADLETYVLDSSQRLVPCDLNDYYVLTNTDEYNLIIYSDLIRFTGVVSYKVTDYIVSERATVPYGNRLNKLKKSIYKLVNAVSYAIYGGNRVVISEPHFKCGHYLTLMKMMLLSRFKIVEDVIDFDRTNCVVSPSASLRSEIDLGKKLYDDDFVNLIVEIIPNHIPIDLLENFEALICEAQKQKIARVYYTAVSTVNNTCFNYLVGVNRVVDKCELFIHQHGAGGYGTNKFCFSEYVEKRISSTFLTFGWGDSRGNVEKFFCTQDRVEANFNAGGDIGLIISTDQKYFRFNVQYSGQSRLYALEANKAVIRKIPQHHNVVLRLHSGVTDWDEFSLFQSFIATNSIGNVRIESESGQPFHKYLFGLKLAIFDYIGSTYAEALLANVPTIVYLTFGQTFSERMDPIAKKLTNAGIFHDNVDDAIEFIVELLDNGRLENWWHSKMVQDARLGFVNTFMSSDRDWINELVIKLESRLY